MKKLKGILNEAGIKLSDKELKEMWDSIGGLYQWLRKLDVKQLSFDSKAQQKKFESIKNKALELIKDFSDQWQKLKDLDSNKLGSKQNKQETFLKKLVELKKSFANLKKDLSLLIENKQKFKQISKLTNKIGSIEQKLNKILQKYGISNGQVEFAKEKNRKKSANGKNTNLSNNRSANTKNSNSKSEVRSESKGGSKDTSQRFSLDKEGSNNKIKKLAENKIDLGKAQQIEQKIKTEVQGKTQNGDAQKEKIDLNEITVNVREEAKITNISTNRTTFTNTNNTTARVDQVKLINQIAQQMEQLNSVGKHELTLKLEPDFLGKLNLKMAIEDGMLTAKLMAENHQVKKIIETQLPRLRNALAEKNVEVEEMVVDVGNEDAFGDSQSRRQFQQREFFEQKRSSNKEFSPELLNLVEEDNGLISVAPSRLNWSANSFDSIDYVI
jgi:flagellar hook-length control protein FliK